jgi:predicted PurR-regulated permease PerM
MSQTRAAISGLFIMLLLLYFLLASGRLFLRKLVRVLPRFHHRRSAVKIVRHTEHDLSRYLGTMILVNIGLGVAVGVALYLLGMPNPALWGALAALLNFIPYIGPLVNVAIVGLVAVVSFDSLGEAALPPLAYLALNSIEAGLVTPAVMGWRLRLNPVAIVLAVTFWTWIWGIPGGLLAVPMLTTFKITCDHVEVLAPIGEFLGR